MFSDFKNYKCLWQKIQKIILKKNIKVTLFNLSEIVTVKICTFSSSLFPVYFSSEIQTKLVSYVLFYGCPCRPLHYMISIFPSDMFLSKT